MSATTTGTGHDLEALMRILAVRGLLDAYAAGLLIPTPGALTNLADVLVWASRHTRAADFEREVAA